jgi:hypothetical protein
MTARSEALFSAAGPGLARAVWPTDLPWPWLPGAAQPEQIKNARVGFAEHDSLPEKCSSPYFTSLPVDGKQPATGRWGVLSPPTLGTT